VAGGVGHTAVVTDRALSPHTVAVAAGRDPSAQAMLNPPIALGSNFRLTAETDHLPNYSRNDGTVTWQAFEEALGLLEGGQAIAFSSGMAAVTAVLEQLPTGAVVVVPTTSYVGVRQQLAEREQRGRVTVRPVDATDTDAVVAALEGASLLWLESPSNPTIDLTDLPAVLAASRVLGVPSVVDSTFATPVLQHPLAMGADVVLHSVTKFIGGHSDLLMGALVAEGEWYERLLATRGLYGAVPGALEVYLALRGLRTLPLRVERASNNAQELAKRLYHHPAVRRVRYPGLRTDPWHRRAQAQMIGFGPMLSFDLADGDAADRACARVRLVVHATSLGGVETTMERRNKYPSEAHVDAGLIRMSVGIEDVDDLWDDLQAALEP